MAQERIIEKRGLAILSTQERRASILTVTFEVLTGRQNLYYNTKYNPPKSLYGYATVFQGAYVSQTVPIEYPNQVLLQVRSDLYQTAELIACLNRFIIADFLALEAILSPLVKVGSLGISEPVTVLPDTLETAIKLVLAEGVTGRLLVQDYPMFQCISTDVQAVSLVPDVPAGNPTGSPLSPTAPYDPTTNDNGDTYVPGSTGSPSGTWEIVLNQDDCSGTPYSPFAFSVPGNADDSPVLAESTTANPSGGTAICCGVSVPLVYVVSSVDGRNMLPSGGNINARCGNVRISSIFVL
jgi:hypothetical protein